MAFGLTALGIVVATSGSSEEAPKSTEVQSAQAVPRVSMIDKVKAEMSGGALLVDVRTAEEYAEFRAQGAINHPLAEIENGVYPRSEKSKQMFVYCRSGNRSAQAKELLEKAGYTNVTDLGGLSDWVEIGGTLIQ